MIILWVGNDFKTKHKDEPGFIDSNDRWFFNVMEDDEYLLSKQELLKEIDGAEIINIEKLKIETPHGVTDLRDISTGLKTLLNILYMAEKRIDEQFCVNLDECGDEVISLIFNEYKGDNINFYISRPLYVKDFNENYGNYSINGIIPTSKKHLLSIMEGI
jgi:hypothetical protein